MTERQHTTRRAPRKRDPRCDGLRAVGYWDRHRGRTHTTEVPHDDGDRERRPLTMTASGTIVYVHGASDRAAGVEEHVRRIRESLAARAADYQVVAADWGDVVGIIALQYLCHPRPSGRDGAPGATLRSEVIA